MKVLFDRLRKRRLARTRLRPTQAVLLFRQMEMLLGAGILLSDALASLEQRFPDARARRILRQVRAEVVSARCRLSTALGKFPRSFPTAVLAVVAAGEEAGSLALAERFADLADRLAYEASHRRELRRACAYPAVSVGLALALLAFLLKVTLPRLEELLRSLGGTLPPLTRAVIALAASARSGLPIAAAGAVAGAGLLFALRRWPGTRRPVDRWLLGLPIGGPIYREMSVALFCKIYRSLYLAGQTAPEILEACVALTGNEGFRAGLRCARAEIAQRGATLSGALEHTGLFPPIAILALETGEQSGRLAEAMERVSVHFQARARNRLETALAALNPALTLAVVAGAGVILIAFFQALYQIVYVAH
ncbi:MAG: type II secretion system F family protein [Opitutaceae bacterium]